MLVRDLIHALSQLPPDAPVIAQVGFRLSDQPIVRTEGAQGATVVIVGEDARARRLRKVEE